MALARGPPGGIRFSVPSFIPISPQFCRAIGGPWSTWRTGTSWPQGTCISPRWGHRGKWLAPGVLRGEEKSLMVPDKRSGVAARTGLSLLQVGLVQRSESNSQAPSESARVPDRLPSCCPGPTCAQPGAASAVHGPVDRQRAAAVIRYLLARRLRSCLSCRAPRESQGKERRWSATPASTRRSRCVGLARG